MMKKIWLIYLVLLPIFCSARDSFIYIQLAKCFVNLDSTSYYVSYKWKVNGCLLSRVGMSLRVKTHYPKLDTIIFYSETQPNDTLLTRFKPKHKYTITLGCCAEGFDVHDDEGKPYMALFDSIPDWQYDSLRLVKENCLLDFKMLNYHGKDTLIGVYGDLYGCLGSGFLLKNNQTWKDIFPSKSMMADNKNYVIVAKRRNEKLPEVENDGWFKILPDESFGIWCESIESIKEIHIRFMYGEKITAVYDASRNTLELELKD